MIKNILSGISAYAGAFSLISRLKLGKYFVIPIVISVLTATIIGFTAYGLSDTIGQFLAKIWIWDWGKETVTTIASFVGAIFVLVIGLIVSSDPNSFSTVVPSAFSVSKILTISSPGICIITLSHPSSL